MLAIDRGDRGRPICPDGACPNRLPLAKRISSLASAMATNVPWSCANRGGFAVESSLRGAGARSSKKGEGRPRHGA